MKRHNHPPETYDAIRSAYTSKGKLLFLGGLMGLTPSLKSGSGLPLPEAAKVFQEEQTEPGYAAHAEFIERELFVPEDREV